MLGVPMERATNVFCNNESVVKNSSRPESTLKKRHNAIAYHHCREAQAAATIRIAFEPGETNLADLFTKLLAAPTTEAVVPDDFMVIRRITKLLLSLYMIDP
jgi:hypothetical protein